MDKFLETVEKIWENSFVQALVYLIVAFVAAFIASFIVKKICKLFKVDDKFTKWGVRDRQGGTAIKFIGKLVFLIVFLLFLPPALNALGLDSVSKPITDFAGKFIDYIPNVIAALVLVFVGIFVGGILEEIISLLLSKTKIDSLTKKYRSEETEGVMISSIIGKIVNAIVVLIAVVQALTVLDIEAISAPALSIIDAVFGAIPDILLTAIVVAVGLYVANLACKLLLGILEGIGFDGTVKKLTPEMKVAFSPSKLITNIVRILIILFIIAQGIEILNLALLANVMSAVLAYIPMIIKAVIIALVAYFGANALTSFMKKAFPEAKTVTAIGRILIYTVAAFMILSQLDFATTIVNYAFIISLCALGIAFAIAFGIGGRDFAKKTLDKVDKGCSANNDKSTD